MSSPDSEEIEESAAGAIEENAVDAATMRNASVSSPSRNDERPGHPVRDAVLITVVAVALIALLVFAVFKLTIRPRTERRPASIQSMRVTNLPVQDRVFEAVVSPDDNYTAFVLPIRDFR